MIKKIAVPTIFTLVSLCILIALGVWQLQRQAWKNGVLAQVASGIKTSPVSYDSWKANAKKGEQFVKVNFSGKLHHGGTVYVHAIRFGRAGYLVFTPVLLDEKHAIFVNRGYIPKNMRDSESLKKETEFSQKSGFIRLPEGSNYLTPKPEYKNRFWYSVDLVSMKNALGASALETGHYIELFKINETNNFPDLRDPKDYLNSIPNRHFEYALTWFALALTLVGVYIVLVWSKVRE